MCEARCASVAAVAERSQGWIGKSVEANETYFGKVKTPRTGHGDDYASAETRRCDVVDHHEMSFWIWACLRNAQVYLDTSNAEQAAIQSILDAMERGEFPQSGGVDKLRNETHLAAYHFVASMGVLIRVLQRALHLFPAIQPAYSRANHLLSEGKSPRDMVEHAYGKDGYLAGGGKHPEKFVRQEAGIAADAISTIITENGHWLGNRLNVERIIAEVQHIQEAADRVPEPDDDDD